MMLNKKFSIRICVSILLVLLVFFLLSDCVIRVFVVIEKLILMDVVMNRIDLVNLMVVVSLDIFSIEIKIMFIRFIMNNVRNLIVVVEDIVRMWWVRLFFRNCVCVVFICCFLIGLWLCVCLIWFFSCFEFFGIV